MISTRSSCTAGARLVVIMDDNPDGDTMLHGYGDQHSPQPMGPRLWPPVSNVGYGGFASYRRRSMPPGPSLRQRRACTFSAYPTRGEAAALDTDYRFVVLIDGRDHYLSRDAGRASPTAPTTARTLSIPARKTRMAMESCRCPR